MIRLSPSEAALVFAAYIPGFRENARGHYRGPAAHRGGDNPTALSVDIAKGYYDHVTGEGGDAVSFVARLESCSFVEACQIISSVIGREVLSNKPEQKRPRINPADQVAAELFCTAYCWAIEQQLECLKELFFLDNAAVDPDRILTLTRLLTTLRGYHSRELSGFYRIFKARAPRVVARYVRDAKELCIDLARALAGATP